MKKHAKGIGVGLILFFSILGTVCLVRLAVSRLQTANEPPADTPSVSSYSDFIDTYYVDPDSVTISFPKKKRNLIHIYLESLETTYADRENGGAFSVNLIPELTELSHTYEDFSSSQKQLNGAVPLTGSTWTMGALFAQTSGLPLALPIDGNAMNGQSTFLPDLVTLGDLLEAEGYSQVFLIGSQGYFGGRELYFIEHGDYQILDYDHFTQTGQIPSDYYVWWGFEDLYLIDFARELLTQLHQQGEPFNLTLLTVDTHYEDGYVCAVCPAYDEADQYANVIRCSSQQIGAFIKWIQDQDFYDNTTVILTGDHLTMDRDFCSAIPEDYSRKVYTTILHSRASASTDTYREYSTFDIFPTTLAALGVTIEGDRLGLGTNLYSDIPTLSEQFTNAYLNTVLKKDSLLMEDLTSDVKYVKGVLTLEPSRELDQSFTIYVGQLEFSISPVDLRCLVWTKEDRSDAKWYVIPYEEGAEHAFFIPSTDFPEASGRYYTEVYMYGNDTMMYQIGNMIAE